MNNITLPDGDWIIRVIVKEKAKKKFHNLSDAELKMELYHPLKKQLII